MSEFEQFLKSLELDESKIKTISEKFEGEIKAASLKVEKETLEKYKDYDDIKSKVDTLSNDLQKANTTLEEKNKSVKTLEETLKNKEKEFEGKLNNTIIGKEIEKSLLNIKNGELLKSQIDTSKIKLNKEGKIEGLDEQMESLKSNYPDFFNSQKLSGQTPQQLTNTTKPMDIENMTTEEVAKNWSKILESKNKRRF